MINRYALGAVAAGVLAVGGLAGFAASASASPGQGSSEVRVVQPAVGEQEAPQDGRDGRDCPDKGAGGGSSQEPGGSAPSTPGTPESESSDASQL
jgi:hypothetical protein